VGDNTTEKINSGLLDSEFDIIILSKNFFKKQWPREEQQALIDKQMITGKKVILPVWHDVTKREVFEYSPILAGKFALKTKDGIDKIVKRLIERIKGFEYVEKILAERIGLSEEKLDTSSLSKYLLGLLKEGRIALFNKKRHNNYKTSVDFHDADLSGLDLEGLDLSEVNLRNANLERTSLRYTNLYGANIMGANLCKSSLGHAALKHGNLEEAKIIDSDLEAAYLDRADLQYANLTNSSLKFASISCADLRETTLTGTNLYGIFGLSISQEDAKSRGAIFKIK
jgi:uncharacterized protein YjbI with pentapeptide repeats